MTDTAMKRRRTENGWEPVFTMVDMDNAFEETPKTPRTPRCGDRKCRYAVCWQ